MSSGQRPRWPAYFPRMKQRGKGRRRRKPRIVLYDERWRPIWFPALRVDGQLIRIDLGTIRITGCISGIGGYWYEDGAE